MGIKQQIEDNSRLYGNTYVYKGEVLDPLHLIVYVNGNREEDEVSRLTEIAAQKAARCDELYEALERVREVLLIQDHPLLVIESQRIEAVLQQKKFCMTCDGTGEIEDTEDNVWPCYECREEETKK